MTIPSHVREALMASDDTVNDSLFLDASIGYPVHAIRENRTPPSGGTPN